MTQRAASCTVDVAHPEGNKILIFINRPDTNWIDYIRFDERDPTNEETIETGKVGTSKGPIPVLSGPMSCVAMKCQPAQNKSTTDIRLYFVMDNKVTEAVFAGVGPKSKLDSGWLLPDEKTTDPLSIMKGVSRNSRAIDQSSYMSSGIVKTPGGHFPYIIWQASGQATSTQYACATKDNDRVKWSLNNVSITLKT